MLTTRLAAEMRVASGTRRLAIGPASRDHCPFPACQPVVLRCSPIVTFLQAAAPGASIALALAT